MAAAAEARAEGAVPPLTRDGEAPPAQLEPSETAPEKRAPAEREEDDDGDGPRPGCKRRRAHVAALESVPRAAKAAGTASRDDGEGFTFHARSFSGVETTPKFGSFNPGAAELVAFHPRRLSDSAATEDTTVAGGGGEEETAEGTDGKSRERTN